MKVFRSFFYSAPALGAGNLLSSALPTPGIRNRTQSWKAPAGRSSLAHPDGAVVLAFRTEAIEHWKTRKAVAVMQSCPSNRNQVEVSVSLTGSHLARIVCRAAASARDKPDCRKGQARWLDQHSCSASAGPGSGGRESDRARFELGGANQVFDSRKTIQYAPYLAVVGEVTRRPSAETRRFFSSCSSSP